MDNQEQLLESLIESNRQTNTSVQKLAESVNELVVIDAARAEREKNQEEKNDKYDSFISENREPLARVKRFQGHWDKASDKVFTLIAIAGLAAAGFNFLG